MDDTEGKVMEKYAFKMNLTPGLTLLKEAGISDYSIHLDEETCILFGVLWRTDDHKMNSLPEHAVMQKWWAHMADIMETKPNNEPVAVPLTPVFHMP